MQEEREQFGIEGLRFVLPRNVEQLRVQSHKYVLVEEEYEV